MNSERTTAAEIHLANLVGVYDPIEAELVRNTLADHGINCMLEGEHQAGFTGTLEIGVLVREGDIDHARKILEFHHPHLTQ